MSHISPIKFFYKNVIDTSLNDDVGGDIKLSTGTMRDRCHNSVARIGHAGTISSIIQKHAIIVSSNTTSTVPIKYFWSTYFGAAIRCQESPSCEFPKVWGTINYQVLFLYMPYKMFFSNKILCTDIECTCKILFQIYWHLYFVFKLFN
jgi:hypothetical protein